MLFPCSSRCSASKVSLSKLFDIGRLRNLGVRSPSLPSALSKSKAKLEPFNDSGVTSVFMSPFLLVPVMVLREIDGEIEREEISNRAPQDHVIPSYVIYEVFAFTLAFVDWAKMFRLADWFVVLAAPHLLADCVIVLWNGVEWDTMDWVQENCDRLRSKLQNAVDGASFSQEVGVRKGLRVPWSWVCR